MRAAILLALLAFDAHAVAIADCKPGFVHPPGKPELCVRAAVTVPTLSPAALLTLMVAVGVCAVRRRKVQA